MAAPGATRLFRQAALDRLSSPEHLDRLITVTRPRSWAALAAVLALLALVVAWSMVGIIPTRVKGSGILVNTGGQLFDAVAPAVGVLIIEPIAVGATVSAGQQLARLQQPGLDRAIENARSLVADLEARLNHRKAEIDGEVAARASNHEARRAAIRDSVTEADTRIQALTEMLKSQQELSTRGLSTRQRIEDLRREIGMAHQVIADARSQMLQIDAEELAQRSRAAAELYDRSEKLAQARRDLNEVVLKRELTGHVLSPASGVLTEWKATPGGRVAEGAPVATIESGSRGAEFVLYIPPQSGKQVKRGMDARIQPSGVKKEEWGMLMGRVLAVSEFPSTPQGMLSVLQNDKLVQQFSAKGAPFAVRVELFPDPSAPTGYRWSSGSGPPGVLTSGMLADGEITVREQSPLAYVLPFLRKVTGL